MSFSDAPVGSHQSAPAKEHAAAGAPNGEEFTSCLDAGGDAWIGERLVEELEKEAARAQAAKIKPSTSKLGPQNIYIHAQTSKTTEFKLSWAKTLNTIS